jgi:DNA-binding response OmpR family regulator
MTLLALSVSNDDLAADVLGRILPASGIALERFSNLATAIDRLRERKFDILIVDFEYPTVAAEFLAGARSLNSGKLPLTVALIGDRNKTRDVLNSGAHFVLYKPLSDGSVKGGLRAAAAVLNRERRHSYRVPVQAQVELTLPDTRKIEGILLDLGENGMEVLTAEPQSAGALVKSRFHLAEANLDVDAYGQVAWANPNGETGIQFLDLDDAIRSELRLWLEAAAAAMQAGEEESVPHCKLTDLSLGGCYVETDSPFPEHSLVELCFSTEESSVSAQGVVRIMHPGQGMGVEFPSRTSEQRDQIGNLIDMLRASTASKLELSVSPCALNADPSQFENSAKMADESPEDSLLELLRQGTRLQQDEFLAELRRQRTESVAT